MGSSSLSGVVVWMCVFVSVVGSGARGTSLVTWMQGNIENSEALSGSLYVVSLPFGSPRQSQVMVTLDLASSRTILPCTSKRRNALTFHPHFSSTFHKLGKRTCNATTLSCSYPAQDFLSLTHRSVYFLRPDAPLLSNSTLASVPDVSLLCSLNISSDSPPSLGVAAFSNGSFSLPSQLAQHAGLARVFAYCLPSYIIFGSRPEGYVFQSFPDPPVNYSMSGAQTTPLIVVNSGGYAVSLEDISVGGESLNLTRPLNLYISTTDRYTKLESSVYEAVQESFRQHIGYGNATVRSGVVAAQAVAPFGTCFRNMAPAFTTEAETFFGSAYEGRIELRLRGGLTWRFFTDSLVSPRESDVICLGIVDSGPNQPSVLGTAQQEGRLVLLDLDNRSLAMAKVDNLEFDIPRVLYRQRNCANFV